VAIITVYIPIRVLPLRIALHCRAFGCDCRRSLGLVNRFIDHLYAPLGTTSNYRATANLHTLQITTAPAKPFLACCVLTSSSLATDPNSEDSSASRAQVLLSQPPVQNSLSTVNSTMAPSLLSFLCRAQLNWIVPVVCFITPRRGPHRKRHSSIVASVCFRGNGFTEPVLRNDRLFIRLLDSNDCTRFWFRCFCLATGLYSVISTYAPTEHMCVFQPVPLIQRRSLTQIVIVIKHRPINRSGQFQDQFICC
jgi:hypothetical protein